jgi:hypothetical protein
MPFAHHLLGTAITDTTNLDIPGCYLAPADMICEGINKKLYIS